MERRDAKAREGGGSGRCGAPICACAVSMPPRHEHSLVGEPRLLSALEHVRDERRRARPLHSIATAGQRSMGCGRVSEVRVASGEPATRTAGQWPFARDPRDARRNHTERPLDPRASLPVGFAQMPAERAGVPCTLERHHAVSPQQLAYEQGPAARALQRVERVHPLSGPRGCRA